MRWMLKHVFGALCRTSPNCHGNERSLDRSAKAQITETREEKGEHRLVDFEVSINL